MTLFKRLFSFFTPGSSTDVPVKGSVAELTSAPAINTSTTDKQPLNFLPSISPDIPLEPLPHWLADEESLRDEGIMFGLSDADPSEKVASIRAYFSQQGAALEHTREHHTETIGEINLLIEQRESRTTELRRQMTDVQNRQPLPDTLPRTIASLCLSALMCVGTFFLVDTTLQPVFSNRWIAVGVFLAGMFTLTGASTGQETRLTARRLLETISLPLAAASFILAQALRIQPVSQAVALFCFIFFLFLLGGRLFLNTLTTLSQDLRALRTNHRLNLLRDSQLPVWEKQLNELSREIDGFRTQKWPIVTALTHTEARLTQLNAQRDGFVTLFLSEFELARSIRDRRKLMMHYE
jgi:hypothetical protein